MQIIGFKYYIDILFTELWLYSDYSGGCLGNAHYSIYGEGVMMYSTFKWLRKSTLWVCGCVGVHIHIPMPREGGVIKQIGQNANRKRPG